MTNQKETILFVHGAWHGKWCWDKYFKKEFTENGYRVITFNLPKHDKSGKIKGINSCTINDYVKALSYEVKKLDSLPIIVGHSMGGLIVQKYLENETCKKAVLLASVPPHGVIKTVLKFMKKLYFYPSLLGLNLYKLVDTNEKSQEHFFSKSMSDEELNSYSSQLCSESFTAFLGMIFPFIKITENSNIPMLVMGAENDTIFSINDNKATAKKHQADLIIVDDIAHDMMLDTNHKKVSDSIINWLKK